MPGGNGEAARAYPLETPGWGGVPHLVHGFLGRSRSLGSGAFSQEDLRRALGAAGGAPAVVLACRQVHGARVLAPEDFDPPSPADAEDSAAPGLPAALPAGDALVSASADVVLTIRTADCVPILLMAARARAVAAVHAGWRGLLAGVVGAAVAALRGRYAAEPMELRAAIGPAIDGCCYEFGAEHRAAFAAVFGRAAEEAWREVPGGRSHLELRSLARLALEAAGVPGGSIEIVGPCTAEYPAELHSHRRDGAAAGRQISYVGWQA